VGHLLGCARVSIGEQHPTLQQDALAAARCARVYTDVASGTRDHRPQLVRLLDRLAAGDTVVEWRLDRVSRSLRHLLDIVTDLQAHGVGSRSLQESIDTTRRGGRLVFHVSGALAEFERDLIRDRTLAGRLSVMTPAKLRQARRMHAEQRWVTEIAAVLGVGRATVYRHLTQASKFEQVRNSGGLSGSGRAGDVRGHEGGTADERCGRRGAWIRPDA
jgi:DNA invertase Pin-like site-specific DNA recombinase